VVTCETTATSRTSRTSRSRRNSRNGQGIEPDINPEETPPTTESQLSNKQLEENEKDSKAETEEGEKQKTRREEKEDTDTSTEPASTRLCLDIIENQTDERSPEEPMGLPDVDDAIISQASLPPDGHFWIESSGAVERHRAADANEIDSYIISLQQPQEPLAEPHGLPNLDNALIDQATSATPPEETEYTFASIRNRQRRRGRTEEPEEGGKKRKMS